MALDTFDNEIATFDRDEIVRKYLRDYLLHNPGADVGPNTSPYVDAQTFADQQLVLMHDAEVMGRGANVRNLTGQRLLDEGSSEGMTPNPATGASGFVDITTSSGGTDLFDGDILTDPTTRLRFKCTATAHYTSSTPVPIVGIDTGEETNLDPDTILVWSDPRPGCGPKATVAVQNDGVTGLSGGHPAETEEEFIERIVEKRSNPPASGNDAEYQRDTEGVQTVPVEKCFTIPAIKGAGTTGVMLTVRPSKLGASRRPNATQIAIVEADLKAAMPGDDGIFVMTLLQQLVGVQFRITWADGATTWVDATTWPPYIAGDPIKVDGAATPTTTTLRATTATSTTTPQVGQTIGLYDAAQGKFRRKQIKTVSVVIANKSWDLTFETTLAASDTTYAPVANQVLSPWSDSLDSIVVPVQQYFGQLGPGEQVASFPDPGSRQRRHPKSPAKWPSVISNRIVDPILDLSTIQDAVLVSPTVPFATTVGTPGVSSYLIELFDIAAFTQ